MAQQGAQVSKPTFPSVLIPFENQIYALPLLSLQYSIEIHIATAFIRIRGSWKNVAKYKSDCLFALPLTGTVTDVKVKISQRSLETVIIPKDEATKIKKDQDQKQERKGPRSDEYVHLPDINFEEYLPNFFRLPLEAVESGDFISVDVQYIEPLDYSDSRYQLRLPLRFPGSLIAPGKTLSDVVSIEGVVHSAGPTAELQSSTHELKIIEKGFSRTDFVIGLPLSADGARRQSVITATATTSSSAGAAAAPAASTASATDSKDSTPAADCKGTPASSSPSAAASAAAAAAASLSVEEAGQGKAPAASPAAAAAAAASASASIVPAPAAPAPAPPPRVIPTDSADIHLMYSVCSEQIVASLITEAPAATAPAVAEGKRSASSLDDNLDVLELPPSSSSLPLPSSSPPPVSAALPPPSSSSSSTPANPLSPPPSSSDQEGNFLLFVTPPTPEHLDTFFARNVVFLLDRSGSMTGDPYAEAARSLAVALNTLRPRLDHFNICAFDHRQEWFRGDLVEVNPANIFAAIDWVRTLPPQAGGTDIRSPLQKALTQLQQQQPMVAPSPSAAAAAASAAAAAEGKRSASSPSSAGSPTRKPSSVLVSPSSSSSSSSPSPVSSSVVPFVVLITDGCVHDERDICHMVRDQIGQTRILTFGIGSYCNWFFLKMLAEIGRGFSDVCYFKETIYDQMVQLVNRAATPVLTSVRIDIPGLTNFDVYPHPIPDLFIGAPVAVAGRYAGVLPDTIYLVGYLANGQELRLPINPRPSSVVPVRKVLIKQRLDLLTARAWLEQSSELKDRVVDLSCSESMPSAYTTMVSFEPTPEQKKEMERSKGDIKWYRNPKALSVLAIANLTIIGAALFSFGDLSASLSNLPIGGLIGAFDSVTHCCECCGGCDIGGCLCDMLSGADCGSC